LFIETRSAETRKMGYLVRLRGDGFKATNQQKTDRYWNAIVRNGGRESQYGWCKDKWGVSWQITPRVLTEALVAGGDEAKRAFDAMMGMKKIDVAAIEAARRG
jgi:predicted 3-demethylubiquinone-9 3-methyltransferase (glyoxalase superfamily)